MAYVYAEADPAVLQSYFKTLPAPATPLVAPTGDVEGAAPLIGNPYAGAYSPFGYAGHPGYGYGAYPYGAGIWNGPYGGKSYHLKSIKYRKGYPINANNPFFCKKYTFEFSCIKFVKERHKKIKIEGKGLI